MPIPARPGARRCAAAVSLALAFGAGCHQPIKDPAAEAAIARATGTPDSLVWRVEGGPIDEPGETDRLSLADALESAVATDPALQSALARIRIAIADARQARLLPNPLLNLILKFPEGGGKPGIEAELTADLLALLQAPRRVSAADHRLRAAAAEALTTALDVAAEAQERYLAVQALEELMPSLEERRTLLAKLARLAQDRLDAGEGTRSDVTTLETERVELDVEIAQQRQDLADERLRLARLIGRPSSAASWPVEKWTAPAPVAGTEPEWVRAGLANRPEVQAAQWELMALGDDRALAASAAFEGTETGAKADRDDGWAAGPSVTIPVPVFDTGQARQARASAQQIEARHNLTRAQRLVVEDVRRAYRSFAATRDNLERVRTGLIPLQRRRREQAEDAYRAGQTDITSLFLSEQDLQASLARQVELERANSLSLIRLQRAVGGSGIAHELQAAPIQQTHAPAQDRPAEINP